MDLSTSVTTGLVSHGEDGGADAFMLSVSMDDEDDHSLHSSDINRAEVAESVLPYLLDSDCLLTETSNLSHQVDDVYHSSAISLHSYSQVLPSMVSESLHNYSQPMCLPTVGANTEVLHNYSQPWPQSTDSFTSVHNYCINNDLEPLKETPPPQNEVKIYRLNRPSDGSDEQTAACLKLQLVDSYICQWQGCTLAFTTTHLLIEHISAHIKSQQPGFYQCLWKDCTRYEAIFDARYKLVQHMRIHTAERPHKCSLCQAEFSSAEGLTIHQRVHTGEKPYPCTEPGCSRAFKNSGDRHRHVKSHKVKYAYYCKYPDCGKKYTDPGTLRRHAKLKHMAVSSKPSGPIIEKTIQSATLLSDTGAETALNVSELSFTNINGSLYCEDKSLLLPDEIGSNINQCTSLHDTSVPHNYQIQNSLITNRTSGAGQDAPLDLSNSISPSIDSEVTNSQPWITFNPLDDT